MHIFFITIKILYNNLLKIEKFSHAHDIGDSILIPFFFNFKFMHEGNIWYMIQTARFQWKFSLGRLQIYGRDYRTNFRNQSRNQCRVTLSDRFRCKIIM